MLDPYLVKPINLKTAVLRKSAGHSDAQQRAVKSTRTEIRFPRCSICCDEGARKDKVRCTLSTCSECVPIIWNQNEQFHIMQPKSEQIKTGLLLQ